MQLLRTKAFYTERLCTFKINIIILVIRIIVFFITIVVIVAEAIVVAVVVVVAVMAVADPRPQTRVLRTSCKASLLYL